jgi:hypothetical protein
MFVMIILFGWTSFVAADEPGVLSNVEAAFAESSNAGALQTFPRGRLDVFPGGHIQGIQLQRDIGRNRFLAFLSHDSQRQAYVVVAAFAQPWGQPGELLHVHRFSEGRLRHAGGFQLLGNVLAIGLEDNRSRDRSEIQFWNAANPTDWQQLNHLMIKRTGEPKDKTAGAVAIARQADHVVVAVANWDSRAIDFYRSSMLNLTDDHCHFEVLGRWIVHGAETFGWQPDQRFGSYQAVNLVAQSDGALYLLGFHQRQARRNFVDLYAVDLSVATRPSLRKVAAKQITLSGGNHFKYGGGVALHRDQMWFLSTERTMNETVRINVAK